MDGCRIDERWKFNDLRTIIMENQLLRVVVLTDHGAKIHEIVYKPSDRDFLYHNPRISPTRPVYGLNVDNWWTGGLDECIPCGWDSQYKGELYPALGDVWSESWSYEVEERGPEEVTLHLWCPCRVAPLLVERWITLRSGEAVVHVSHKVTNISASGEPFEFIWGLHPGFALNPEMRINLPAGQVVVDEASPDYNPDGSSYAWPYFTDPDGHQVDMRVVQPPEVNIWRLHYAHLQEGWLALTDTAAKEGIGLVFPLDVFPYSWLWLVYGGWRGLYCAGVEAWTGYPPKLEDAVAQGRFCQLKGAESLEAQTKIVIYTDLVEVTKIKPTGEVIGREI
jgi:hypothetical protein